jgi:hypothetical protein
VAKTASPSRKVVATRTSDSLRIEEEPSKELLLFGCSGFLRPSFLSSGLEINNQSLLEIVFSAEATGRPVFMGSRQIATANENAGSRLVLFFGKPSRFDPKDGEIRLQK